MSEHRELEARSPAEDDLGGKDADFSHTEGAHVLASEAKDRLQQDGFSEEQILEWAETYVSEQGSGSVDAFIAWVHEQQGS